MKLEMCSCCGEIISKQAASCNTCGSHYCANCKNIMGKTCICCGDKDK